MLTLLIVHTADGLDSGFHYGIFAAHHAELAPMLAFVPLPSSVRPISPFASLLYLLRTHHRSLPGPIHMFPHRDSFHRVSSSGCALRLCQIRSAATSKSQHRLPYPRPMPATLRFPNELLTSTWPAVDPQCHLRCSGAPRPRDFPLPRGKVYPGPALAPSCLRRGSSVPSAASLGWQLFRKKRERKVSTATWYSKKVASLRVSTSHQHCDLWQCGAPFQGNHLCLAPDMSEKS